MPKTLAQESVLKGESPSSGKKTKQECGRMGGSVKSSAKARAVRKNGKKGGRPRGSASGFPVCYNSKLISRTNAFNPKQLTYLSAIRPPDSTLQGFLAQLRKEVGIVGLMALGLPHGVANGPASLRYLSEARLVFYLWSSLFCPSNLASAFHMATWGRFNADMPQDYRAAALRLLDRKSGPARARLEGRPHQPFRKPWQGKVARRMLYVVPPSLPLL